MKRCVNCGGFVRFSPDDKGNKCLNCGSVFPIDYKYNFKKKEFEEAIKIKKTEDDFAKTVKIEKCKNCGATILFDKLEIKNACPYCGAEEFKKLNLEGLLYIDSIIPFAISKEDALKKFKLSLVNSFYANKKIFNKLTISDVLGCYVNAFIFDFKTTSKYSGVLSYEYTVTNSEGERETKTGYKQISGEIYKEFNNLTIESNSNLEQSELNQVMPYIYSSAVDFDTNFMNGYSMEYHDKLFDACFKDAQQIVKKAIENSILKKYNCDRIESLDLSVGYDSKKYNYCILPVYFISKTYNNKKYRVIMNGQTGKIGRIPKSGLKILLTILGVLGLIGIIILICYHFI